jgi:hypothetical protein
MNLIFFQKIIKIKKRDRALMGQPNMHGVTPKLLSQAQAQASPSPT